MRFNPRARVGRDVKSEKKAAAAREFQSTRPRGARHIERAKRAGLIGFQSTRPRGARHADVGGVNFKSVFQSTRPRGARPTK